MNLQEKCKDNRNAHNWDFKKKMADLQMLDGMDVTRPIIHYGNE
jgi:hypothetical protein